MPRRSQYGESLMTTELRDQLELADVLGRHCLTESLRAIPSIASFKRDDFGIMTLFTFPSNVQRIVGFLAIE
jgi:hypothetical protein